MIDFQAEQEILTPVFVIASRRVIVLAHRFDK